MGLSYKRIKGMATLLITLLLFQPAIALAAQGRDDFSSPMQERVQAVFARIVAVVSAEHPEVVDFTIQAVKEKVPNAWINPKNEIYVSSGLLELLTTDDQLAGVIGHEIAHGTLGHIPHRVSQTIWSAFAVIALGTVASSQGSSDWGGLLHMRDLFMYAFGREQESEADLVGMGYARAAGYSPHGLVEALQLMDKERRKLPSDSIWQQLYRTHPPISQRITDLRFVLATEQLEKAPLQGSLSPVAAGARSPEEAAQSVMRALLTGDEELLRPYVLPGRAAEWIASAVAPTEEDPGSLLQHTDPAWAQGELEVIERKRPNGGRGLVTTQLLVRLWRSAPTTQDVDEGTTEKKTVDAVFPSATGLQREMSSPVLSLTLQQSVRGWIVTDWERTPQF